MQVYQDLVIAPGNKLPGAVTFIAFIALLNTVEVLREESLVSHWSKKWKQSGLNRRTLVKEFIADVVHLAVEIICSYIPMRAYEIARLL
ncbi:MAG: hypothetical protein GY874_06605 [Desulfobacteraceae bacterium]|nr:hypothetical protein [Desulfobacteraceae bacterium]